jgi:hypothetical protein
MVVEQHAELEYFQRMICHSVALPETASDKPLKHVLKHTTKPKQTLIFWSVFKLHWCASFTPLRS